MEKTRKNEVTSPEKICRDCLFWQPNGGVLGFGYCLANKWTYRRYGQTCDKWTDGTKSICYEANMKLWREGMSKLK